MMEDDISTIVEKETELRGNCPLHDETSYSRQIIHHRNTLKRHSGKGSWLSAFALTMVFISFVTYIIIYTGWYIRIKSKDITC